MRRLITTALLVGAVLLAPSAWARTPGPTPTTPPARKAATGVTKKPAPKAASRKAIAQRPSRKAVQKAKAPARSAPAKRAVVTESTLV